MNKPYDELPCDFEEYLEENKHTRLHKKDIVLLYGLLYNRP